ncbi:MAG TPA: antibiotic biosynthesis monooxygenase [Terracidiphilus sp.]|nr:antibiotic biosynthesis monooxygenase [Terracidiphilus sp.]
MIARHWRGWTKPENADAYEVLLRDTMLPHIRQIDGHRGAHVLRNDGAEESEFVVINFFDSLEAVKRFAGPDYSVAVFEPEARQLLSRIEPLANHYEVRV